jgi:hypothetical protein
MPSLTDLLKIDSIPLAGLGLAALAVPFLLPAVRPQVAAALKSGIKLFLEAEVGADIALADRLVDASVDALMQAASHGTEDHRKERTERVVHRFVSKAHASAHRRGWDEQDTEARYRRRLVKLNAALSRARHRANPSQRAALDHASDVLGKHHSGAGKPMPAMVARQTESSRPAPAKAPKRAR